MTVLDFGRGPAPAISQNDRSHWAVKARHTKAWRDAAHIYARAAKVGKLDRIEVQLTATYRDKRRRDGENLAGTVKAIVDGIVDAGVVRDDSGDLVTVLPTVIQVGPKPGFVVEVTAVA